MKRWLLLLACSHPAAPVTNHATAPSPSIALEGRRAVIVHKFLAHPVSVWNPTDGQLDVATATGSVMLVTVDLRDVQIMLTADASPPQLGPKHGTDADIISEGSDDEAVWRITRSRDVGFDLDAFNRKTGVTCSIYKPDVRTRENVDHALAACRDLRIATDVEIADVAHVFHE